MVIRLNEEERASGRLARSDPASIAQCMIQRYGRCRLVRLPLTLLPHRPGPGRLDAGAVRRRDRVAALRPAPRVSARRRPSWAALRADGGELRGERPRLQPAAGPPELDEGAPPGRARPRAEPLRCHALPADGRLLGGSRG